MAQLPVKSARRSKRLVAPPYNDPTGEIESLLAENETIEEAIARQKTEELYSIGEAEADIFLQEWSERLGLSMRELREMDPTDLQERMIDYAQDEEDMRDAGNRNEKAIVGISAFKLQQRMMAGELSENEVRALSGKMVPRDLVGRFVPMVDPPHPKTGFSPGISLIPLASIAKKRRARFRFLHEKRLGNGFLPEGTLECGMIDGFGDVCEKLLHNKQELALHQEKKHPAEWKARQEEKAEQRTLVSVHAAEIQAEAAAQTSAAVAKLADLMAARESSQLGRLLEAAGVVAEDVLAEENA